MTQTLELSHLKLTPLTEMESREISGGLFWLPAAAVAGLIISAINNFGDIRDGIVDGFNGTPRYPQN